MTLDRSQLAWLALATERDRRPDENVQLSSDPAALPLGVGPEQLAQAQAEVTRLREALKQA